MKQEKLEESEKKLLWIKSRWEFLRRSKGYQENYNSYLANRQYLPSQDNIIGYSEPYYGNSESCPLHPIERAFLFNASINLNHLPDPEKTFEDLLGIEESLNVETIGKIPKKILDLALNMFELEPIEEFKAHPLIDSIIGLEIDLRNVNSIVRLKERINRIIEKRFNEYLSRTSKINKLKKKRYMIDYDIYLKVGDMKDRENLTFIQIAKKMFPRDFNDANLSANPESAETKVKQYYKEYKDLVNGGYIFLSYL